MIKTLVRGFVLAVACIGLAAAQQLAAVPRIGVLANTVPTADLVSGKSTHPAIVLLLEGLRERGWTPGKNVEMVWRSAEGDYSRHAQQARELAQTCDVIVVYSAALHDAMNATKTVPIVMATSVLTSTPIKDQGGTVRIASFARPGGNVTGLTLAGAGSELVGKRLELLKTAVPHTKRVAILGHTVTGIGPRTRKTAETLSIELVPYSYEDLIERLEPAFAQMSRDRIDAVVVIADPAAHLPPVQKEIHRLAERHRMPALHEVVSAVDSGGLMGYGHDINKLFRRAGHVIDRILRGTKAGDIPIEQPADYELRVNLKAARAIGITLPQSLLLQADRIVD